MTKNYKGKGGDYRKIDCQLTANGGGSMRILQNLMGD